MKDLLGRDIAIGDTVAWATRSSCYARLYTGTVKGFGGRSVSRYDHDQHKLVPVTHETLKVNNGSTTVTLGLSNRIVIVFRNGEPRELVATELGLLKAAMTAAHERGEFGKLAAIKFIRKLLNIGLLESKNWVESHEELWRERKNLP